MIALDRVDFAYGDNPVLEQVNLEFPASGTVCLFGPSGCGKTTILRLLAGLETPAGGAVRGISGQRAAVVFQENRLLPWIPVWENVALVHRGSDARERAMTCLEQVGLADAAKAYPAQLSGGMRRRAAIARALAFEGDFLLLDEPFTGLDEALWRGIAAQIRQVYADKLIVLITHIPAEAQAMEAAVLPLPAAPLRGGFRFPL